MKRLFKSVIFPLLLFLAFTCFWACGDDEPSTTHQPPDTSKTYTVTFVVNGISHEVLVNEGELPVFKGSTEKKEDDKFYYSFKGWDKEIEPATADVTYTAMYNETRWPEYQVKFVYRNEAGSVLQSTAWVKEGEIPSPSSYSEIYKTDTEIFTFAGWSLPLVPVTKDFYEENKSGLRLVYDAVYTPSTRLYAVDFLVSGECAYTGYTEFGKIPEYMGEEIKIPKGYNYCCWAGLAPITKDGVKLNLIFSVCDPEQLEWAYRSDNMSFGTSNDNSGNLLGEASAVLYMALEVRSTPDLAYSVRYRDRAVESLKFMVSDEGKAPYFDLQPYWCYASLTAAISTCKNTPEIWNELSMEEQKKYDIVMRSFAYILAMGTADGNSYSTGPGLEGNFGKGWNPNYRLANITPMIFVGKYFGGADEVNKILHAFDYEAAIADFKAYPCFERAYNRWTRRIADEDGNLLVDPATNKPYLSYGEIMENGGDAYIFTESERLGYTGVTHGGTGNGVRIDYYYGGCSIDNVEGIMALLLSNAFAGGNVFSDSKALGKDGIYPETALNPALIGTSKAYILDGTVSPVEGLPGLMTEFNSGDGGNVADGKNTSAYNGKNIRSSGSYNIHNFIMIASAVAALDSLDAYDCASQSNVSIYKLMWVGITDFLYKMEHGYMSYSLGAGYESREGSGDDGYFVWKTWWNKAYSSNNPYGDLGGEIPEDGDLGILSEDYNFSSIKADSSEGAFQNGVSYSSYKKFGTFFETKSNGDNKYLSVRTEGLGGWDSQGDTPQTDLMINFAPAGGLNKAMGNRTSVTFSFDIAKSAGVSVYGSSLRLRGSSPSDTVALFTVKDSGEVTICNGKESLGFLTEEFSTVKITVDFEKGTAAGTLGDLGEKTAVLPIPEVSGAKNALEWLDNLNSYIFNWYFPSNNSDSVKEVLIDNIKVSVNV